jgi:hypothetical protein
MRVRAFVAQHSQNTKSKQNTNLGYFMFFTIDQGGKQKI